MEFQQISPSHSYVSFKCMFYAVTAVQFPSYNLKLNEKNRDLTVEVSHLVTYDTAVDCRVHVATVVFSLVSGRSYTVEWHLLRWTSLKVGSTLAVTDCGVITVLLCYFVCVNLYSKYLEHKIECILFIFCKIEDFGKNVASLILPLFSCLKPEMLNFFFS